MTSRSRFVGFLILISVVHGLHEAAGATEVHVKGGKFEPFFRENGETSVVIRDLRVDKDPVTNQQFLSFVRANPEWSRAKIPQVFASKGYLEHWKSDVQLSPGDRHRPVTNVSWFAARAYCEGQKKRLMTVHEWEYVADAQNPKNVELTMSWYAKPSRGVRTIDSAAMNKNGVRGMHGLIWEWVEDFSGVIMASDSRDANDTKGAMFCGSGSLGSKDPTQYATFMRYAHRSSLAAEYTGNSLGFRCVR